MPCAGLDDRNVRFERAVAKREKRERKKAESWARLVAQSRK